MNSTEPEDHTKMSSTRPSSLTPPLLEAYPFIDLMFRHHMVDIAHRPYGVSHKRYLDNVFNDTWFRSVDTINPGNTAPLQAMSGDTLDRLLYILRPKISGSVISTKATFDQVVVDAYDQHNHHLSIYDPCSLEQIASYLVSKAFFTEPVHWGQMAGLYNESSADQQEAIHQFFVNNLNRQLIEIFGAPAPQVKLPETLSKKFETKIENGETLFYSNVEQQWLNQAALQQVYRVTINYKGSSDPDLLVGTGPTVEQAIALASLFAQAADASCPGNRMTIHHLNYDIAIAEIEASGVRTLNNDLSENDHKKLSWDFSKVGIRTDHFKNVRDNLVTLIENCNQNMREGLEQEHLDICRLIASCSSDTPESFTKAVLSVERALGLQWSKSRLLEDALGL